MITFIQKRNRTLTFARFAPELNPVLEKWKGIGTVRKFGETVFIQDVSFPFTLELMQRFRIPFKVVSEL